MSATLIGKFLCCILQFGIRGAFTGVRPVPPPMRDSKLKIMPVEGVEIGIPAISLILVKGAVEATLRLLGREGFEIGTVELNITFLVGDGNKNISSIVVMGSIISVLTLSCVLS